MNLFDLQITEPDDITDFSTRAIKGTTPRSTGGRGSVSLPEFLAREEQICDEIREKCAQQRAAQQGEKE